MNGLDRLKELTGKLPTILPNNNDVKPVRVMVVENNERTRRLLRSTLEYFGCTCKSVPNGKEAMDDLEKNHYDVLLGHIVMSEETGIGVLRKFQERNQKSMIVIISGSDDNLKEYGKYLSILALPFGFYDFIKTVNTHEEVLLQ